MGSRRPGDRSGGTEAARITGIRCRPVRRRRDECPAAEQDPSTRARILAAGTGDGPTRLAGAYRARPNPKAAKEAAGRERCPAAQDDATFQPAS